MKKKRKRSRLRLHPKPFIVLALVINVTVGMLVSPITSISHLRVENAAAWDQARIRSLAVSLSHLPCARVQATQFESDVLQLPEMRSANLSRNPFGGAVLRVRYRRPVALLSHGGNLVLSIDGVVYPCAVVPTGLPVLQVPEQRLTPTLTLAAGLPWARYADLAVKVQNIASGGQSRIQLGDDGAVWLNIRAGRVKLGAMDDLDAKLRVLDDRLKVDPDYLAKISALILTSPSSPFIVPKKVETKS